MLNLCYMYIYKKELAYRTIPHEMDKIQVHHLKLAYKSQQGSI